MNLISTIANVPKKRIVAAFILVKQLSKPAYVLVRNKKAHLLNPLQPIRLEPTGGKIEANETIGQAAKREALEELGVHIAITNTLSTQQTNSVEGNFIVETVLCTINSGSLTTTLEPNKLDGIEIVTEKTLRKWAVNPPPNCELAPNIISQLEELCAALVN